MIQSLLTFRYSHYVEFETAYDQTLSGKEYQVNQIVFRRATESVYSGSSSSSIEWKACDLITGSITYDSDMGNMSSLPFFS